MRIYVLITKARPLTVHLYREGIARFSSDRYDTKSLKNIYSHLTNTSINKNAPNQNFMGGNFGQGIKWTFE
jgi:tubulin polyglutamylase TTLL2